MEDVPGQYKKSVDDNIIKLMKAAEWLMTIGEELGSNNIKLSSDKIIVRVSKKGNKRKRNKA